MPPLGSEATNRPCDADRSHDPNRTSDADGISDANRSSDAPAKRDDRRRAAATPTTILLSRDGEGWRATQRGVDVVGTGETAPRATAAYCRLLEAGSDDPADEPVDGSADDPADGRSGATAAATRDKASEESRGAASRGVDGT